jgi:signal transduction histidine kinase
MDWLDPFLNGVDYMPHGQCYLWQPPLLSLHLLSDAWIAFAYYSIPILLFYFVRKRTDVPFKRIFFWFSAFILSCGTTHFMGVWNLWHGDYWISGGIKAVTALISCYTVVELVPLIPKALALPSPAQLEAMNADLAQQIEERRLAEAQVLQLNQQLQRQVEELQQLDRLKDDFLSTVSHELRTPLTSMRMAIQMLQMDIAPAKQKRYIDVLAAECTREMTLINTLLDLQRLEAGNYELDPEPLEIAAWLPELVQRFQFRAEENQLQLHLDCEPDLPRLWTDRLSLERVVSELLHNACKYTEEGGQILVKACSDFSSDSKPSLNLQVINTAHIPAAALPQLFDKLYRAPQLDRWRHGGTGLGLALVKGLVSELQGEIAVTSGDGDTVFSLRIPSLTSVQPE